MKTIASTISGLASSLFLNVGLTTIAQQLDPVSGKPSEMCHAAFGPSYCMPSQFPQQKRG
jgi:hypothetical protein